MIVNTEGKVAVKWAIERRPPKAVKIDGKDRYYIFVPKLNIFMAWVENEDVQRLLSIKEKSCNCNNGSYLPAFVCASLVDVNLWTFGEKYGIENNMQYKEILNGEL